MSLLSPDKKDQANRSYRQISLLAAVPAARAEALVSRMHRAGIEAAAVVGEARAEPKGRLVIR